MKAHAWILSAAAAAALAACGGGGGGTTAGSSPAAVTLQPAANPAGATVTTASTAPATGTSVASPDAIGVATAPSTTTTAIVATGPAVQDTSAPGAASAPAPAPATAAAPASGDCGMFPSSAIFNTRIDDTSRFPAQAASDAWVAMVGRGTPFTANWGNSSNPANVNDYWGVPINTLTGGATAWPVVTFDGGYPQKSDCATSADGAAIAQGCDGVPAGNRRFPFPASGTLIEGNIDHHVLVVDRSACRLWEAYDATNRGSTWNVASAATWNLRSNALRPDNWGSADAAGLPITPLLAKASEAASGEIRHALRVTFRDSALAVEHAWPARFGAGGDNPGAIPFGSVLRLKSSFVIPASWSPQAKAVALAAQRYGIYVADNGADFLVQGEPNDAWDPSVGQQLRAITMGDMEFVDLHAVTSDPRFNPDSMQASW